MKFVKKALVLGIVVLGVLAPLCFQLRWGQGILGILGGGPHFAKSDLASRGKQGEQERVKKSIKFAVFSDIHSDLNNLKKALELAKNEKVEFIVVTGDLTTVGSKKELKDVKKILDEKGIEYYVVPGNHDIWTSLQIKSDIFKETFSCDFISFKKEKIKFILINNGDTKKGITGQEVWIKNELGECLKVVCLVFMHMPVNHPNSIYIMGEGDNKVASQAAWLAKELVDNKVKEIFAGHLHFSSSYDLGGFKTNIVGALATERNFQSPKFLEVVIKDGKFLDKKEVFLQ